MAILLFGMAASWGQSPTYGACSYDRDVPWNGEGPNPRDSYHVFTSPEETLNDMRKFGGYPYTGVRICAGNFVHADLLLGAPVSANTWPIIGQATRGICNNLGEVVSTVDVNFEVYGLIQCTPAATPKIIAIDPGHGGTKCADGGTKTGGDTGTTGPTYKDTEHALALSIGLSLRDKLASKGYEVVMTRTTAVCPPLEKRADIANKAEADLFVSIHFNGVNNRMANGTEAHTLKAKTPGWQIATSTSDKVSSVLGTMDRGPKATSLSVLRNTKMPSILVEVAFLSNVGGDEDIMHRSASPADAASAIASSAEAFLNK